MSQSNPQTLWRLHYTIIPVMMVILICPPQIVFALQSDATTQAQRDDQKLLDGLRERQLFDLANDYNLDGSSAEKFDGQSRDRLRRKPCRNLAAN